MTEKNQYIERMAEERKDMVGRPGLIKLDRGKPGEARKARRVSPADQSSGKVHPVR